jgi:hypothetical protein
MSKGDYAGEGVLIPAAAPLLLVLDDVIRFIRHGEG